MSIRKKREEKPGNKLNITEQYFQPESPEEFYDTIATGDNIALFLADWCGPCHMMVDTYNDIIEGFKEKDITTIYVDTDTFPTIAKDYHIKNIPTTIGFTDHQHIVGKHVGCTKKDTLMQAINTWYQE